MLHPWIIIQGFVISNRHQKEARVYEPWPLFLEVDTWKTLTFSVRMISVTMSGTNPDTILPVLNSK
jgi:hypothetical protein